MDSFELFKRRIACVIDYFDEDHEIPWDYVLRTGDGRFEAIATRLLGDAAREHSLGIFDTRQAAIEVLHDFLDRIRAADYEAWHLPDGRLDFNRTLH